MKHLTDQEREFLISISESIGELVNTNQGILAALKDLNDDKAATAIVPFTQQIGGILLKMLTETRHYSQVTENDLNAVS